MHAQSEVQSADFIEYVEIESQMKDQVTNYNANHNSRLIKTLNTKKRERKL